MMVLNLSSDEHTLEYYEQYGIIYVEGGEGNIAECSWCNFESEFSVVKFPDLEHPLFKCKSCGRYWVVAQGMIKRVNRKGKYV